MSLEIIKTPDVVELDDETVRDIVKAHVENSLGRKVLNIRYYRSSSAQHGDRLFLKVDLAFEE